MIFSIMSSLGVPISLSTSTRPVIPRSIPCSNPSSIPRSIPCSIPRSSTTSLKLHIPLILPSSSVVIFISYLSSSLCFFTSLSSDDSTSSSIAISLFLDSDTLLLFLMRMTMPHILSSFGKPQGLPNNVSALSEILLIESEVLSASIHIQML